MVLLSIFLLKVIFLLLWKAYLLVIFGNELLLNDILFIKHSLTIYLLLSRPLHLSGSKQIKVTKNNFQPNIMSYRLIVWSTRLAVLFLFFVLVLFLFCIFLYFFCFAFCVFFHPTNFNMMFSYTSSVLWNLSVQFYFEKLIYQLVQSTVKH